MALGTCITEKEGCYCSKVVSWRLLPGFVFCVGGGGVGLYTLYADNGVLWPILQAIDEDVLPKILPNDDLSKLDELYQGFPNHPGGILVFWMAVL